MCRAESCGCSLSARAALEGWRAGAGYGLPSGRAAGVLGRGRTKAMLRMTLTAHDPARVPLARTHALPWARQGWSAAVWVWTYVRTYVPIHKVSTA